MTVEGTKSEVLYDAARLVMPGGVSSPVRAFKAVGGAPLFIDHAKGSKIVDVDGKSYIDYVASWGAIILGHANPAILTAITETAAKGTSFGAPHEGEVRLAKLILARMPRLDMIRFVNSGTEATQSVIRLARAATRRNKILKFDGNYHGATDSLLAKAGSGVATLELPPDAQGVPPGVAADTLVARYNDASHVENILRANNEQVAAVLVEPVAGNMGCVPPKAGFLQELRRLCTQHGALLIVDEVMTGFRIAPGGATELYDLHPDLVCMGKVIGGGLPVAAYAGRRDLMEMVAPCGPVYQAGTLSGNPLAMAAGSAALGELTESVYDKLESLGSRLEIGLRSACQEARVGARVQRVGSMISVFFNDHPVRNFDDAQRSDKKLYGKLFHALLARGVYLPPSALESWFITTAHTPKDIDRTAEAFEAALKEALG